jgi:molecular chaperone DnaK (HSP70)
VRWPAASHVVAADGTTVPIGGCVLVYDFGASTFDATVRQAHQQPSRTSPEDHSPTLHAAQHRGFDQTLAKAAVIQRVLAAAMAAQFEQIQREATVG